MSVCGCLQASAKIFTHFPAKKNILILLALEIGGICSLLGQSVDDGFYFILLFSVDLNHLNQCA